MKSLNEFTKQYSISKTLRFALEPIGKTREFVEEFISYDNKVADDYKAAKLIIDDYNRFFIEEVLSNNSFVEEDILKELYYLFKKTEKSDAEKKVYESLLKSLCKSIGEAFKEANKTYFAFGEPGKLLKPNKKNKEDSKIVKWIKEKYSEDEADEKIKIISAFGNFTTYFRGFNENRENIYSGEDKHGSVAHRIIENLGRFFGNCKNFEDLISEYADIGLGDFAEIFSPFSFNKYFSQARIDAYNEKIGSISDQTSALRGVNQIINEYRQKNDKKLIFMKRLYKQVLSDKESSFKIDEFCGDEEILSTIRRWWDENSSSIVNIISLLNSEFSTDDYVKVSDIANISNEIYGDWNFIRSAFGEKLKKIEKQKAVRIEEVNASVKKYIAENDANSEIEYKPIENYFRKKCASLLSIAEQNYKLAREILEQETLHKGKKRDEEFDNIKNFLDSVLDIAKLLNIIYLEYDFKKIEDLKYTSFYSKFEGIYESFKSIYPLYNKVRNYATKKPFSTDKIKLNFENSQLMNGWDLNKERDCSGVLFMKGGNYFVGVLNRKNNDILDYTIFDDKSKSKKQKKVELQKLCLAKEGDDFYEKIVYKQIPDPVKMLPKVFFSKKGKTIYCPSEEVMRINESKSFKTNKEDLAKIIEYYKKSINRHEWSKIYKFNFKETEKYERYDEFLEDVEIASYSFSFDKIKAGYIDGLVDEGKLFLFKIYSKDFSEYSKGKPNLHTLYWKAVFERQNLENLVVKLNGGAEIFFRKPSITDKDDIVVHKANEPIKNKNPLNKKAESTFNYDLIKDRRYTKERFSFHCPITLNARSDKENKFNFKVNKFLKGNPDINIIGIDRGERHLLYYSIINQKGEIKDQGSFNVLETDNNYKVDYKGLLFEKAADRTQARRDWKSIGKIKDLKSGYLSHIVHKLVSLMVENNAVIALEDLNAGFKNSRKCFEQSVYQNFEKALIEKLNYLVFKDKSASEAGGYLNAYQLTSAFKSFKDMKYQCGFLFYVPAAYTSKIDPVTGFINTLYPKYESVEKARDFFSKFEFIKYNPSKDYFEFCYDIKSFRKDAVDKKLNKTVWTICTFGKERYYEKKDKATSHFETCVTDITANLKKLFAENNISFESGADIKGEIVKVEKKGFFESLLWNLKILLQMRYSGKDEKGEAFDFILSPVANKNGQFFDSRRKYTLQMPQDADANGAYNIARKCLYIIQNKIGDDFILGKMDKIEWMNYAQGDV